MKLQTKTSWLLFMAHGVETSLLTNLRDTGTVTVADTSVYNQVMPYS